MKKLRIQIEDRVYDVSVEVLEDDEHPNGSEKVKPVEAAAAATAVTAVAPKVASRSPGTNGGSKDIVSSPIAGTVQKVFVQPGGRVEAKAPVLLLDAMKMDTYIYAPRAGTIEKVDVHPGDAVRVGQPLVRYERES